MNDPARILVVDDESAVLHATTRLLCAAGYQVLEATTAEEALRLAASAWPDLILLNVVLPDGSGVEVCHAIKTDPDLADMLVILISGKKTADDDQADGLEGGADGYLVRPIEKRQLLAHVKAMLRIRQTEAALRRQEQRYRRLFEEAPTMYVITHNDDGRPTIVDCNQLFLSTLGYARDEVLERPLADFYTPASRRLLLEGGYQRALQGILTPQERELVAKDGRIVAALTTAVPETDEAWRVCGTRAMFLDISARKRAEESLQQSEALLKTTLEIMPVGVWMIAGDGRIVSCNAVARQMWGGVRYVGIEQYDEYKGWWTNTGRRIETHEWAAARAVERGETSLNELFDIESFNGSRKTILNSAAPIRDADGQIVGAVTVNQDVTHLRQVETELNRRVRELGLLNRINAASAAGLEPPALLETACRELTLAFDAHYAAAILLNEEGTEFHVAAEHRAAGEPAALDMTIPVADTAAVQCLLAPGQPLMLNDPSGEPTMAPYLPLAERYRAHAILALPLTVEGAPAGCLVLAAAEPRRFSAEDAGLAQSAANQVGLALARARLAQTRRLLSTAVEQAAESVVITDTDWHIVYVNPAFERVSGYSRAEVMGRKPSLLKSGQHDAEFYQVLEASLSAGQTWHGRFINKRKDGSQFTEEATISPARDESGVIVNYVAVKRDITHELALEEQFLRAQRMEAVGQLTAGIAHDFNNLLTAVNGFAELLMLQLPSHDPGYDMAAKILSSGRRGADLVSQLLNFSRKQMIQPRILNLNDTVAHMDNMLQRIIGEHIQLVSVLSPDLWSVRVDRAQIEQVIVNLAVNARDAMPGGGTLTIETKPVVLDDTYVASHMGAQPGDYVLLVISDTGTGMSPAVKARIFEPFFTTKGVGKGTGLGLSSVYGIIKQHNGNIWVYSEEGQGSTFKIYLPRVLAAAEKPARSPALQDLPAGQETILLAEDNGEVRELARRVLHGLGYRVLEARDGVEAMQVAADYNGPIHLLLTDVVMPEMSGQPLADRLTVLRPGIKKLFMTGYTENVIMHHAVLEKGVILMEKPFSPMTLASKVRQVLDS